MKKLNGRPAFPCDNVVTLESDPGSISSFPKESESIAIEAFN